MKTKLALCIITLAGCFLCGNIFAADNLGHGYVSSVTSSTNCVFSDTNDGGIQFWDIQAGGTYTVTLSGVDDAANTGMDSSMSVIVHNSAGGNICTTANYVADGVYTFTLRLGAQCLTMPIEYGTLSCNPHSPTCVPVAGCQEGTGMFARQADGTEHEGHLRTTIFDENCNKVSDDTTCQGGGGSTGSITVCKYYDNNANGFQDTGEASLTGWPFCINPLDGGIPALVTQLTGSGGCATWSNLTTPGDYVVTEANANESNWFHSTGGTSDIMLASGGTETRTFGNYCTSPSGGLTLGFWSNKNGNKIITGSLTGNGTILLPAVVTLLNSCQLVNANGSIHTFNNNYSQFRTWLLGATATNMAYMLSAQLAALKLDVAYAGVDGNAFDLCSHMTITGLIGAACDSMTGPGNQLTLAGNPSRPGQEMLKNCIDKINNNGDVIPVTPCPFSFTSGNPCP